MGPIFAAYGKAFRSLLTPGVFWHICWPIVCAVVLWGCWLGLGWLPLADELAEWLSTLSWLKGLLTHGFASEALVWACRVMLFAVSVPAAVLLIVFLVAGVALPLILDRVSRAEYDDLELRHGGSLGGSLWNAGKAAMLLCLAGLICLPLLFVPVLGIGVLVVLSAWFNRRCFRYDALMNHADAVEMRSLPAAHSGALLLIGLLGGLAGLIPFLNLLAPILTGLAFTHFLLAALREARAGRIRR